MFPDKMLYQYFDRLIGRVYKILPLKEQREETLPCYLEGLVSEMIGVEIVSELADQPYYISVVGTIAYLASHIEDCEIARVKREVFNTINLCQKLRDSYRGGDQSGIEP